MASGLIQLVEMEEELKKLIEESKQKQDLPAKKEIDIVIHELRMIIHELNTKYQIRKPWWQCIF